MIKTRDEHAKKLKEISDYAFAFGTDSIGKDKFKVNPLEWESELKTDFITKCHDGFKIAQKMLLEEFSYYQGLYKDNTVNLKKARVDRDNARIKELIIIEKTIKHRLRNLSHIADGIAWQLLQGEIHIARRFHIGQNASKFLEDSNIDHAIRVSEEINNDPLSFCLISDLTSFVQIGDLLIRRRGNVGVMELKEGKVNEQIEQFLEKLEKDKLSNAQSSIPNFDKNTQKQMERMLRQKQRTQNALEVINKDTGIDPGTGEKIHIGTPSNITQHYHKELHELHEELKTGNYSYKVVEGCLHIGMYRDQGLLMAKDTIQNIIQQDTENFVLVDLLSITENLSAPLFAKPFEREFIIDILTGRVKVILGLNMDNLLELFNSFGLEAEWISKKESARIKQENPGLGVVFVKNRAISIKLANGNRGIMSGGIISKILFDSINPSSMAMTILSSDTSNKKL